MQSENHHEFQLSMNFLVLLFAIVLFYLYFAFSLNSFSNQNTESIKGNVQTQTIEPTFIYHDKSDSTKDGIQNYEPMENPFPMKMPYDPPITHFESLESEIADCGSGLIDCKDFDISKTTLVNIPYSVFKNVVTSESKHTNVSTTKYYLSSTKCKLGEYLDLKIYPRDSVNKPKTYLGDYFNVRLIRPDQDFHFNFSIAAKIDLRKNHTDNSYFAKVPCFESGKLTLQVHFIRSSETQETIKRVMAGFRQKNRIWYCGNSEFGPLYRSGIKNKIFCGPGPLFIFEAKNESICAVDKTSGQEFFEIDKRQKRGSRTTEYQNISDIPMCAGKNVLGTWINPGHQIHTVLKSVIPFDAQNEFYEYLGFEKEIEVKAEDNSTNLTIFEQIEILKMHFKIKDTSGFYKSSLSSSKFDDKLQWYTKFWQPSNNNILEQFRDKKIVMVGDSLIRKSLEQLILNSDCQKGENWNFLGLNKMKKYCKHNWANGRFPKQYHCRKTNTSIYSLHHGQPFHLSPTNNPCQSSLIHVSDLIDRMIEHKWVGEEFSIYATYGAHLSTFNPIVFARLLINVKNAVAKYKIYSPKSQFIFRTTTMLRGPMENTWGVVNGFNQERFREITYRIFGDDENIRIFDPFESVETLFDKMPVGDIHPNSDMIRAEVKFFADFYAAGKDN